MGEDRDVFVSPIVKSGEFVSLPDRDDHAAGVAGDMTVLGWWHARCVRTVAVHGWTMGSRIVAVGPMSGFWGLLRAQGFHPLSPSVSRAIRDLVVSGLRAGYPVRFSAAELLAVHRGVKGRTDEWIVAECMWVAVQPHRMN